MERYYKKKKFTYQIVTNDYETVGLELGSFKEAESILKGVLKDENYLQELCPDTDISTIEYLAIEVIESWDVQRRHIGRI